MLGRYQSNPGIDHWKAVKKALRYIQGTKDLMLTYKKSDNLEVVGYSDADFARCVDTKKSTSKIYLHTRWWSYLVEKLQTNSYCFINDASGICSML